jgi:predicted DNA-binding WGR domain protein
MTIPAPRARTLYLMAFGMTVLATLLVAYEFGTFREELHPDPTRGNYGPVIAIIMSIPTFFIAISMLVIGRWFFWPKARSTLWKVQLILAFAVLTATSLFIAPFFIPFNALKTSPEKLWIEVEGTPVAEGWMPAYFPPSSKRLEWYDKSAHVRRFKAFALEGATAYRQEGYVDEIGSTGYVEKRDFPTPKQAQQEIERLIKKAQQEGYELVPEVSGE